ncbi:DUF3895 domain-containing protein [Bacillus sp. V5-8f]|uniref:DUF3895 domain-containing protein n=1 Tax=Bacillus sp. V5-8f TaxID=2053044 RepID=UPI000C7942EE|nr:DUF3895 domain-containing protein [Bacillus sp. V5-8f]PLT32540.1 hypothetical protein CUU64_18730 [Bacillus sp. V5-8f]
MSENKQLDIFSMFVEDDTNVDLLYESKDPEKYESDFERQYGKAIMTYVEQGKRVTEICDLLISEHQAPDERYSSGKTKLYPLVMIFLRKQVERGLCTKKQSDQEEGIFELN